MILFDVQSKVAVDHIRGIGAISQELVDYKTLARVFGAHRKTKLTSYNERFQTKANAGSSALSSLVSTIVPGDSDRIQSPVRSIGFRTITPGRPGIPGGRGGSKPGGNSAYRCPEGYQFGGRFTDNRLTTCGLKLFDIPSALGVSLSLARQARSAVNAVNAQGTPITGMPSPSGLIASRAPQIPKIGIFASDIQKSRVAEAIKAIGEFNKSSGTKIRRMVRRDGFVLEPVVPNKVLRAIPDNRDMEGAAFIMSALSPRDIGGEELGMLSNTGVGKLVYVLPGGSTISIEKARQLTVGERRKLGRLVSSSQAIPNANDPSVRLRSISAEIGDGIKFTENFINIPNPNERSGRTVRWANQLFSNPKREVPQTIESSTARNTVSFAGSSEMIGNLDEAINHIADGGSLADISPDILAKVLSQSNVVQSQKMANGITAVTAGGNKYFLYERPKDFQHIGERFASDLQQHLGLESPDVIFAGPPGDKRKFLRQEVQSAIPGGKFNPDIKFADLPPQDVARMMISDFLTDQRDRPMSSIYPVETPDGARLVLGQNSTSGLIDLDKISVTQRNKIRLESYFESTLIPAYSQYYMQLQATQRVAYIQMIDSLIAKARSFNVSRFSNNLDKYGISTGEKLHLNIIQKLYTNRLNTLSSQKNVLKWLMKGTA